VRATTRRRWVKAAQSRGANRCRMTVSGSVAFRHG
jgi:hypothetical protein